MNKRNLLTLITFLSIIFLPFWIYLPLLLASIIIFPFYWEAIALAFLVEVLHGRGATLSSPVALTSLIILIIFLPLRERIRINV